MLLQRSLERSLGLKYDLKPVNFRFFIFRKIGMNSCNPLSRSMQSAKTPLMEVPETYWDEIIYQFLHFDFFSGIYDIKQVVSICFHPDGTKHGDQQQALNSTSVKR